MTAPAPTLLKTISKAERRDVTHFGRPDLGSKGNAEDSKETRWKNTMVRSTSSDDSQVGILSDVTRPLKPQASED